MADTPSYHGQSSRRPPARASREGADAVEDVAAEGGGGADVTQAQSHQSAESPPRRRRTELSRLRNSASRLPGRSRGRHSRGPNQSPARAAGPAPGLRDRGEQEGRICRPRAGVGKGLRAYAVTPGLPFKLSVIDPAFKHAGSQLLKCAVCRQVAPQGVTCRGANGREASVGEGPDASMHTAERRLPSSGKAASVSPARGPSRRTPR